METSTMAKEAIKILKNDPEIGFVLLDMIMDGYAALKIIRHIPSLQDIPIIAVTGYA